MRKAIIFLVVISSGQLLAQINELDTIIIRAQQIDQKAFETGRSVEVISAKEIAEMPVQSVDEMLRYVTGMNINTRNGFGVQADIGMRGSTFTQVLVLVDNVRLNDPLTGHFNHNFPVALADIAQIEIVKGPAAVSYGADAVGGLIHIKTKSYVQKFDKEESDISYDFAFGQNALLNIDAGIYSSLNKLTLSATYRQLDSDGETLENPNFIAGFSEDSTFNNFFNLATTSFSAAYRFSDSFRVHARYSKDERDFKAKYFYTASAFDESREETSNNWGTLALISERDNGSSELNVGYRVSTDFFEFNPLFSANEHEMTQQFVNFNNRFELGEKSNLALGVQYINKEIESTDRGNHLNTSLAGYGILTHAFDKGLFANASVRVENDENFGTEFLPQLSLSYTQGNWVYRTSYGRSIRAADFTERYVSFLIPSLSPGRNAGNPDLVAERSNSFDLGADYRKDKTFFSITAFYRASTNLIDFSLTNQLDISNLSNLQDSADYLYANNISSTDVAGVETSFGLKNFNINSNLSSSFRLNYTYLQTSGEGGELSKYISNHPTHNFSFLYDIVLNKKLGLNLNANYVTREEEVLESINAKIPASYFLMNTKVYWSITPDFSLYGKILNTLDTNYQEILGAQAPGRWWLFGVNWKFKK